ncbi:cytochrome p450 oxidoreductase [Fusarium heterosporum]|uniref:Cytochrome p450 oxidoreductase n=1 Tax=Fusarium heterosporum TaxID=42747 RepID=A0A8H5SPH9_FUSHE|nr:cytochrome p450 oxidoreductase [Fusarium heterosporum]
MDSARTIKVDLLPVLATPASIRVFLSGLVVIALFLRSRTVLNGLLNGFLSLTYRIQAVDGKKYMPGPAYAFPNGQMVDKFLAARTRSWEWEEKYGKTYRIWAASIPEVVITDPKDVEALYYQSTDHRKAPQANAGWLLTQLLGSGLGLINGTRWTTLRKTLDPMFSHLAAMQYLRNRLDTSAEAYIAGIHKFAKADKQDAKVKGIVINATQALQRYPFLEVASMFYGRMSDVEQERLWELGRQYSEAFSAIVFGGIHRSKITVPETPIILLMRAAERGDITTEEVTDTIAESTFANLDIVTQVISSCVILLADSPEVQGDLFKEIEENKVNREKYITRKDTLLHFCLLESLRLRPVLAFTFPENPPREKILGNFVVPKNTTVIVDAFAINIRNPFWGPDNRSYRPSRFASIKQNQCLGQHIANNIVKAVVYHMFSKYKLSLQPVQGLEGDFKVDKTSWVGLYDVDLRLEEREIGVGSNVIVEGDERWPDAIKRWTGYRAKVPAAIVRVFNEEDVISVVSYAVKNQRPFVVRGGGHSNGFSTVDSPGIVIDLSGMRNVTVDVEKQVLVAQGGATMGDGVKQAGAVGMAVATGTCNEVGLVGATLGGGIGRFLGHLGYAADTVLSMRVVVVGNSGVARVVEASNEANSDLLWGLRGSGHLFGVVVEATFRAFPWSYDTWHTCLVFLPNDIRIVAEAVEKVHYRGGMQGRLVFCAPNKQPVVLLQLWYMGPPEEAVSKFQSLLDLPSLNDHSLNFVGRRIPYLHLNDSSERICSYAGRKNLAAFGMSKMSAESCEVALKVYVDFIAQHPEAAHTHILTEFYSMDVAQHLDPVGQGTSIPVELREEVKYWVMPLAWYEDPALDKACAELNKDIQEAFLIQPDGKRLKRVGYVNMPFEDDATNSVFGQGERLERLKRLKSKWDPLGVIQGIIKL